MKTTEVSKQRSVGERNETILIWFLLIILAFLAFSCNQPKKVEITKEYSVNLANYESSLNGGIPLDEEEGKLDIYEPYPLLDGLIQFEFGRFEEMTSSEGQTPGDSTVYFDYVVGIEYNDYIIHEFKMNDDRELWNNDSLRRYMKSCFKGKELYLVSKKTDYGFFSYIWSEKTKNYPDAIIKVMEGGYKFDFLIK